MTTETNNSDTRVSEAYRALATETTPPELDDTILKMAASNVPTRYARVRGWLRPVAWAATIGLSLAFILEISRYQDIPVAPAPVIEKVEVRAISHDAAVTSTDEDIVNRKLNKHADAPAAGKALAPSADSAMPAAMESAVQMPDVATDGAGVLPETEETVRLRASEARPAASPAEKKEQAEHCDAAARATAESWYSCVEGLKEDGLADAARQELDALLNEFPDFREPDPDR
jgi:hypothetical protein